MNSDVSLTSLLPLIAWSATIGVMVDLLKRGARRLGIRHHWITERILGGVPLAIGALSGALAPVTLGVGAITGGEGVHWMIGAFFGVGAGAVSGQVFNWTVDLIPGARGALKVESPEEVGGGES